MTSANLARMWALIALTPLACSDSPTTPEERPGAAIARIVVNGPPSLEVGQSVQLTAVASAADGQELSLPGFAWTSTDDKVAVVDSGGRVTGTGAGTTRIRASSGEVEGWRLLSVAAPPRALARVSGGDQPAAAGRSMPAPLVVSVHDAVGGPVEGVSVSWSVTSGEATLDGQWRVCESASADVMEPVLATSTPTDSYGLAAVTVTPLSLSEIVVEARLGTLGPVVFAFDAADPEASLQIVSGDGQERIAGSLPIGGEPLVVRLVDGAGEPMSGVRIDWSVAGGSVVLLTSACQSGRTGDTWGPGTAYTEYRPLAYGTSRIASSVQGVSNSPRVFTTNATLMQVVLAAAETWLGEPFAFFAGPTGTSKITLPIGGEVEFWNRGPEAHIVSTSAPAGGTNFDSGVLNEDGRYRFHADAVGAWIFKDTVSGATGTLSTVVSSTLSYDPWVDAVFFSQLAGPIPVGMGIEIWNHQPTARIVAATFPGESAGFDSGPLVNGARVVVVPDSPGTWGFADQVSGAEVEITVH